MGKVRAHLFISGQVQGVGFRHYTRLEAVQLGLAGWVRNVRSEEDFVGVEAVFEGPKEQVEEMIKWCKKGSPAAAVRKVKVVKEKPEGLEGFEVGPSV